MKKIVVTSSSTVHYKQILHPGLWIRIQMQHFRFNRIPVRICIHKAIESGSSADPDPDQDPKQNFRKQIFFSNLLKHWQSTIILIFNILVLCTTSLPWYFLWRKNILKYIFFILSLLDADPWSETRSTKVNESGSNPDPGPQTFC
jgi:hypothetical protein